MKLTMRFMISLLFGLAIYASIISVVRDKRASVSVAAVAQRDECEKAHPWQHTVNGECVDKPHVTHYHGDHSPGPGEACWIECLCDEGESPSGNSCGPCSYMGTVCIQQ